MPGVTTSSEALQILQNSSLVANASIRSSNPLDDSGGANWKWRLGGSQLEARLWWRDGIIREVILPTSSISVDEIINRYGFPEKVIAIPIGIPENWEWGVTFYYSTKGFQVQINGLFGFNALLKSSATVSFITLFESSTVEERISFEGYHITDLNLQDWKGYGSIPDLYYIP